MIGLYLVSLGGVLNILDNFCTALKEAESLCNQLQRTISFSVLWSAYGKYTDEEFYTADLYVTTFLEKYNTK